MKKCTKCKVEKELTEFGKHNQTKDGKRPQCKSCRQVFYKTNKEKILIKRKILYKTNKEKISIKNKALYEANKEKL